MSDYERIAGAIDYIVANAEAQPGLEEVAAQVALSPFHFQRLFARWVGLSPKRFLQVITVDRAKRLLAGDALPLLDASETLGLSSTSRLHDHFVQLEAVTPGEFKAGGLGLTIRHGVGESPFGRAFIAWTPRGICALRFIDGDGDDSGDASVPSDSDDSGQRGGSSHIGNSNNGEAAAVESLVNAWPRAALIADSAEAARLIARVFSRDGRSQAPLSLHVSGTNFQIAVWRALLSIPEGRFAAYGDVARAIGKPRAVRAVGTAVGANPCAFLIPCHRVIRSNGEIGGYRWGVTRKHAINAWEAAASDGMLAEC